MVGPTTRRDLIAQATKGKASEIALRGLTRPLGVHPPARHSGVEPTAATLIGQGDGQSQGGASLNHAANPAFQRAV